MENKRGILFATLLYLWRTLTGRRDDARGHLVDQPRSGAQRRAFVRGGCVYPFALELDDGGKGQGAMLNVSGSGLLFVTKLALPVGASFRAAGRLFGREMSFRARVARLDPSLGGFEGLNAYGALFVAIAEADRRAIIRAVFSESRHLHLLADGGDEL